MFDYIQGVAKKSNENLKANKKDYFQDFESYKLLYCGKCHKKKQKLFFIPLYTNEEREQMIQECMTDYEISREQAEEKINAMIPPKEKRRDIGIVSVLCDCQIAEREKRKQEEQEQEKKRLFELKVKTNTESCFPYPEMQNINFNDYEKNLHTRTCKRYCEQFKTMQENGKSLVLCGKTGAGKTIASLCLANDLLQKGISVLFKTQMELSYMELSTRNKTAQDMIKCDMLIIDDFNLETANNSVKELLFYVIDSRNKAKKPFLITSNHIKGVFEKPENNANKRILERIRETAYIIEDSNKNYRE